MDTSPPLGECIRELRTERRPRLTQHALAERAGVSVDLVAKLEHHLVFDADKLHFYSATCYAWLGMADPAEEHAGEVIRQCGDGRWKTRFANAHVDLGLAPMPVS